MLRCEWCCVIQGIAEAWCVCAQLAPTVGKYSLFAASLLHNFSLYHSISPFLLRLIVQTKHTWDHWGGFSSELLGHPLRTLNEPCNYFLMHIHTAVHITVCVSVLFTGQLFIAQLLCFSMFNVSVAFWVLTHNDRYGYKMNSCIIVKNSFKINKYIKILHSRSCDFSLILDLSMLDRKWAMKLFSYYTQTNRLRWDMIVAVLLIILL